MTLDFLKMSGAGNDFILLDDRNDGVRLDRATIARLCHRQFGIGADGLMLLVPCTSGRADWAWRFYNSDGSDAEMCGNGARCFARFIQRVTGWPRPEVTFETLAGVIHATLSGDRVTIGLTDPANLRLHQAVPVDGQPVVVHSINTGVPHAVVFVPDADKAMVQEQGSALRHHPHFQPRGTNVNFAQLLGHGRIRVRTYERGVEGETLACGTGVTATALVAATIHGLPSPVRVQVQGGDELEVAFDRSGESFKNVRLNGPATFVFEGRIHV